MASRTAVGAPGWGLWAGGCLVMACSVGSVDDPFQPPSLTGAGTTSPSDDSGSGDSAPGDTGDSGVADASGGSNGTDDSAGSDGSDTVGPPCGDLECDANAMCEGDRCVCGPGFEGDGLSCADIDGCAAAPCFAGVECADVPAPDDGYTCGDCPPGTEGDGESCAEVDGCAGSPCFMGVACEDVPAPGEGFLCGDCPAGYEGDGEVCGDIDGCAGGPCYPGVMCMDVPAPADGFECGDCPPGSFGDGITCLVGSQYEIGNLANSANLGPYFRANGYLADSDGVLVEFEQYLGNAGGCSLDFYVFEAAGPAGALTQIWRNTVVGAGSGYQSSGPIDIPITSGTYYALGVGWNCSLTYYWNSAGGWIGFDAGVGLFENSRWDNGYPGASDFYVPPNTGGGGTAYPQRITFAG